MTIPRRSLRAGGKLAAATVVGLTGTVLSAGPAAAHTPTWAVTCTEVSLDLTAYNGNVTNQVTVDGKTSYPPRLSAGSSTRSSSCPSTTRK
ncbi:hypothetical protein GCM10010207_69680 [Streptomyces atratus]|nr:hypothetical protein GCM10010207_69680 [Streptomyces atratus]